MKHIAIPFFRAILAVVLLLLFRPAVYVILFVKAFWHWDLKEVKYFAGLPFYDNAIGYQTQSKDADGKVIFVQKYVEYTSFLDLFLSRKKIVFRESDVRQIIYGY